MNLPIQFAVLAVQVQLQFRLRGEQWIEGSTKPGYGRGVLQAPSRPVVELVSEVTANESWRVSLPFGQNRTR